MQAQKMVKKIQLAVYLVDAFVNATLVDGKEHHIQRFRMHCYGSSASVSASGDTVIGGVGEEDGEEEIICSSRKGRRMVQGFAVK